MKTQYESVCGLLPINKRPGVTSFEALWAVKKAFGTGKAGHTGTLDKFASGLLLALTGRAVKLAPWLGGREKEYLGTVRFGEETSTLDPEGEVVARGDAPSREAIEAALPLFRGQVMQAPPAYSALHIDGKRAYELARGGAPPEMKKRPVTIYRLELLSYEAPLARLLVRCSPGTYIRSLARDIALAAGSRAHLSALVRARIDGLTLEGAPDSDDPGAFRAALKPLSPPLFEAFGIPSSFADEPVARALRNGRPLGPLTAALSLEAAPEAAADTAPEAAAVFTGGPEAPVFTALLQRGPNGAWTYGYVRA